jgi:hypothetical protein
MPYKIEWPEIALRLLLTVIAGGLLGMNRSEHGHAAGLVKVEMEPLKFKEYSSSVDCYI